MPSIINWIIPWSPCLGRHLFKRTMWSQPATRVGGDRCAPTMHSKDNQHLCHHNNNHYLHSLTDTIIFVVSRCNCFIGFCALIWYVIALILKIQILKLIMMIIIIYFSVLSKEWYIWVSSSRLLTIEASSPDQLPHVDADQLPNHQHQAAE